MRQDKRNVIFLFFVLLLAASLRAYGLFHDLPFSYYGDEMHFIKRSVAMGTGDLNPYWFHKPAFLMYLLFLCYSIFYAMGSLAGAFESTLHFGAYFLSTQGPFILIGRFVVALFGMGSVYLVYLITRKVFNHTTYGILAALIAAILAPIVASSQVVKADVPAGFFVLLASYFYVKTQGNLKWSPLILAAIAAGLATGTKYYGFILLPSFLVLESLRLCTRRPEWKTVMQRCVLIICAYVAAFFVVSPYNFLDPTFGRDVLKRIQPYLTATASADYDPDSGIEFERGYGSVLGATGHFLQQVVKPNALSYPLSVLAVLGFVGMSLNRQTRWHGLVLFLPVLIFSLMAVTVGAYHAQARHLNAIYPLLCPLIVFGVRLLITLVKIPNRIVLPATALVVCVALMPSLDRTIRGNAAIMRLDSRTVSSLWLRDNLPQRERMLLDDYGPILMPNTDSIRRTEARLNALPVRDAFTKHQSVRLALLRDFPSANAFNIDELGHPWWSPVELSNEELRMSAYHRDMSNPLHSRVPKSLAAYRKDGIRFVVTNSRAQRRYFESAEAMQKFPSFVRFYSELRQLKPIRTFDPLEFNGKGPVVWVYDLQTSAVAERPESPQPPPDAQTGPHEIRITDRSRP